MKPGLLLGLVLILSAVSFHLNSHAVVIYPKEPDGGREMVMQFANHFVGKNLPPFEGTGTTNDLTFAPPLPAYGTGDLAKEQLLTGATSSRDGWQMWKYIMRNCGGTTLCRFQTRS